VRALRRLPLPEAPWARALLGFVALLLALNLAVIVADALRPSPGGEDSSSYGTRPRGVAAWADLARRSGIRVEALRRTPSDDSVPAGGTLVVLDPGTLLREEGAALRGFAERGGTLVAGGRNPELWLGALLGDATPEWRPSGPRVATPLVPVPEVAGVSSVRTAGEGRWTDLGPGLPVLAGDEGALLAVAPVGRGRLVLLADTSPLQNRLLGSADNAALALALSARQPLTFAESLHGYGEGRGLGALPAGIRGALWLLLAAALALMLARGKRLGPPEPPWRELPPPRAAYVDALAATLARGRAKLDTPTGSEDR
jgi:hypothetical protein